MSEQPPGYGARSQDESWNARRVRDLRDHLGDTQREFADRLGTRQQTVSEWETGASSPRAMARRLLHMVAEERGFYSTEPHAEAHGGSEATPVPGGAPTAPRAEG